VGKRFVGQGKSEQTIASAIGGVLGYDYQIHERVTTKALPSNGNMTPAWA
jgi:hypothetical protein